MSTYCWALDLTRSLEFHIPAQPLAAALIAFSNQADVQVVTAGGDVTAVASLGITGRYSIEAGLKRLLQGTDLTYRVTGKRTISIVTTSVPSAASTSNATPIQDGRRLAQADQGTASNDSSVDRQKDNEPASQKNLVQLEEIVVTGTHISGAGPVGSNLSVYTQEQIEQSGATSLADFARQMPDNLSNVDTVANASSNIKFTQGLGAVSNSFNGAAFNLRGLGAASTLTLLNGHRLAPGGNGGSFVDLSAIPLSAIDHIDVLTDGASAIYGADAVGGVVNIVTRTNYDGAESQVRYGGTTDGGGQTFTGAQLLGKSWGSGNVLLNYDYTRDGGLDASQRDYILSQGGPFSLIAKDHRNSLLLSGKQDVSDATAVSGSAMYSRGDFSELQTAASSIITEHIGEDGGTTQSGANLAIDHFFTGDRHVSLAGSFSKLQQEYAQVISTPALAFGTSDADTNEFSLDALGEGPLLNMPGGPLKAAFGAGLRIEKFFDSTAATSGGITRLTASPDLQRHVGSAFGELFAPFVSETNEFPMVKRLDASIAVRYDHYGDFGSTTNPKFGLRWSPVSGLDLRGTYGRSFRAPLLSEIGLQQQYYTQLKANPVAPTGVTDTLFIGGGNPNLKPEKAKTYTAGFEVHPIPFEPISLSADYFNIDYRDRIASLPVPVSSNPFVNPVAAQFLVLSPPLAQIQELFASPEFVTDYAGRGAAGVTAIFDSREENISASSESGLDLKAGYDRATAIGHFNINAAAAHVFHYDFQPIAGRASTSLLDTFGQPTSWRGSASVGWSRDRITAVATVNYVGGYENTLTTSPQAIKSWTTSNLFVSYKTGDAPSLGVLRGLSVALSIDNVTDERPPYVQIPAVDLLPGQHSIPFDPANASPLGRLIAVTVTKKWW